MLSINIEQGKFVIGDSAEVIRLSFSDAALLCARLGIAFEDAMASYCADKAAETEQA
jgi:hypothetical protein